MLERDHRRHIAERKDGQQLLSHFIQFRRKASDCLGGIGAALLSQHYRVIPAVRILVKESMGKMVSHRRYFRYVGANATKPQVAPK